MKNSMLLYWEIFKKELTESKWAVFWFWFSLVALAAMYIAIFPVFAEDAESMEPLFEAFPPALLEIFGVTDIATAMTFEGFMGMEYFSLFWIALFAAFIIAMGRKLVAKEVEDKTADVLFTLPARRSSIFLAKFASFYVFSLIIAAAALASIFAGGLIVGEEPNMAGFMLFFLLMAAFNFFMLAFTGLFSALVSGGTKVIAAAGGFFMLSYALHVTAILNETVEHFYFLSFFKYYGSPHEILREAAVDWVHIAVFAGIGLLFFIASLFAVGRRDL